ncbi:hypothetical protein [Hyphomicrobium sp. 99]|uniref:hypothetical protein n=1 Tax=Hyphomicrobium sp. 99 TaxID=1163419 RepID=UPI0005F7EC10|nr:hypothetical protein [Hyphomicrobium sp. 99]
MDKALAFLQVQDKPGIIEIELLADSTVGDVLDAMAKHGVTVDADALLFVNEDEDGHELDDHKKTVKGIKRGCRLHLSRCRKIAVSVNFLERTIDHKFAPGARVRKVKAWAVDKLKLDPKDAGEHVLRLCGTDREPATDTPLHELTNGRECSVCFDLVPVKRVEG